MTCPALGGGSLGATKESLSRWVVVQQARRSEHILIIQCFLTHKWLFLVHVISCDSLRHCPLLQQWHYFEKVWFSELSPDRNLRIALLDISPKSRILHVGLVHHKPYQIPADTGEMGLNAWQLLNVPLPIHNSQTPWILTMNPGQQLIFEALFCLKIESLRLIEVRSSAQCHKTTEGS